ncbi:ABC transporter ATP-binding protein [Mesorhizobium sp. ASY16-5R]|uniref:ABC transporter ATP-binding protein n=1 Tax=Mesorhizobium sp. ASY16-5R TaxID=3445772 RepID=UPI003F9F29AC
MSPLPRHPMLTIDGLTKSYGGDKVVDGSTFRLDRGEIVALLGPSGCGKTTTLRMIAGFVRPDGGRILIENTEISASKPYERNIGVVFQDYALFPHMSVAQNVAFGPRHRGVSAGDTQARVRRYLDIVRMGAMAERLPAHLSGGQQQRVALARALATEPQILLLDEPLSALDAKLREHLRSDLKLILQKAGVTTIIVTHDQEEALSLADRVMVMNRGRILQDDRPEVIYRRPANRFTAEFVGRSNWLPGQVVDEAGKPVLRCGPSLAIAAPEHLPRGRKVQAFVRPERVRVRRPGDVTAGVASIPARIRTVIFLGQDVECLCEVDGLDAFSALDRGAPSGLAAGDPVELTFDLQDIGYVEED